ncbi:histidine kinase [Candidatus Acidianus copahuensis]|uniref:Histidine kinase n=1 Tax=Candidatus Acidianus copahuensis TaxID=1160895 RepID=A0A031LL09_9CREN|nr:CBS domain-containing protein [Candidatus Acidianus copahuensis]EZQ04742.1 histidine kinase [Candidatus Acidianus copahuensis]
MLVKTLEILNPPVISDKDNLTIAFKKINERGIGRIIIANPKVEGILSTRDLLSIFLSFCTNGCTQGDLYKLSTVEASQYMTSPVTVITENADTLEAITLMVTRNFGSLVVINEQGIPSGIITERELLLEFQDLDPLFPVYHFMTKKVSTIDQHTDLTTATKQMLRRGFRRLPVVDEDKNVLGIITAADSIKSAAKSVTKLDPDIFFAKTVKDIMRTPLVVIEEDRSINEAASMMIEKSIGSLVILDDAGKIKGIITERDLLIALHYQIHLSYVGKLKT